MKNAPTKPRVKEVSTEFWFYFALLFVVELPISMVRYVFQLVDHRPRKEALRSPFHQAWTRAWANTPQIFEV